MPSKLKAVIDTNVWVSGIFWGGTPGQVLSAWKREKFNLIISPDLLDEIHIKLSSKTRRLGLEETVFAWLELIRAKAVFVIPKEKVKVCRDPKDNMLLEASLASGADFLVSGDEDLLTLKNYKGTRILTPKDFLEEIK